jgi:CDP-6-deoxy-D-xylo-4-hexulose-3-dehydrase
LDRSHIKVLSNFAFPVLCKTPMLKEQYLVQFAGAGVEVRPMIAGNIQRQPFYKKYVGKEYDLPGTDRIHDCGFYFGNYPELDRNNLEILLSCFSKY